MYIKAQEDFIIIISKLENFFLCIYLYNFLLLDLA